MLDGAQQFGEQPVQLGLFPLVEPGHKISFGENVLSTSRRQ